MRTSFLSLLFILSFSCTFSQVKLDSGLVAYYPFNGNANDESGNGNNAIYNNASLTADKAGNPNSAYSFNGVDNYIRIANSASINPSNQISLCALVKPSGFYKGPCHGNSILMKGDDDYLQGNYFLRFDDNAYTSQNNCNTSVVDTIHQNFYSVGAQTPSPGYIRYINKDQWYCIVFTNDGTTSKFYVDGMLMQTQSQPNLTFTNSYDLFLGKLNNPSFPYWFNGTLDEVRIYNRAIDSQEVATLCPSAGNLPVTITKFAASVVNNQIKLDWNAENEDGIVDYTIERSVTGHSDFIRVGTVAAHKLKSYSFVDNTAGVNQNYYYRLVIRENTNAISYSEVKIAKILTGNKFVVVYPNPSQGNIKIKIIGYSGKAVFTLTNSVGQTLFKQNESVTNNNLLPLTLKAPKGIYSLKIETINDISVQRIMIY